jgi:CBS-domain-containing membrane protein
MKTFRCLHWAPADGWRPDPARRAQLDYEASALELLEDLTAPGPVRMPAIAEVCVARLLLEAAKARWGSVVDETNEPIGVVTLRELQSPHSAQRAQQLGLRWVEVPVRYLMTPLSALPVIGLDQLRRARVGDLTETLCRSGSEFLLVGNDGRIRGIVACSTLVERTGRPLSIRHQPASFAEIAQAMAHPDQA